MHVYSVHQSMFLLSNASGVFLLLAQKSPLNQIHILLSQGKRTLEHFSSSSLVKYRVFNLQCKFSKCKSRKTVCLLPNEAFIQTNPNVLMPISSVDWQTKGPSIIERALLFLQYLTKLINLLSTLLHELSNYTCIKASSAIYWVLRNNIDIFLVTESRD